MSAATDSRNASGLGAGATYAEIAQSYTGPIADNVNLPAGSIAAALAADTNTSPVVYPFTTGASKYALGIVKVGGDNTVTGHKQGAFPIAVRQEVGKFIDNNAGGGSAIAQTDRFKPAYAVDNQTVSKLPGDGECVGMIMGLDTDGSPMVGVGPMFKKLAEAPQVPDPPVTFTQTYSTADATVAALTAVNPTAATVVAQTAITDNGGGAAADGTIAVITNAANAGSADVGPTADAIKELSTTANLHTTAINALATDVASLRTQLTAVIADILAMKKNDNKVIDVLQSANLAS